MEHSQEEQKLLVSPNVRELEEGPPAEGEQAQHGQSETSYVQLKLSFQIIARKINQLLESERKLREHTLTL